MKLVCSFEASAPEAERIWNAGCDLYERISEQSYAVLASHPHGIPMFCDATLLFASDVSRVAEIIEHILGDVEENGFDKIPPHSFLTLPLAMESYYQYTADKTHLGIWVERCEKLFETHEFEALAGIKRVFVLGFQTVLMRLRAECGMPMPRVALGHGIVDYHKKHYDPARCLYRDDEGELSLIETVLVAGFGFISDDARDVVRNHIIENAFELPREWCGFLYTALSNLEVEDAFFACLVESGLPTSESGAEHLAGIVALVRYMVGVDLVMLGCGIECATPRMPEHISYKLLLPCRKRYLSYEREGSADHEILGGIG